MNRSVRRQKLASMLGGVTAAILALLPFQALITTWPGSVFGHLDLFRIWKEILIAAMIFPAAWLALQSPKLRQFFKTSWLVRAILLYGVLTIGEGIWALDADRVNRVALIYALIINLRFFGFFLVCVVVGNYHRWLAENWLKILLLPSALVIAFGLLQRLVLPFNFLKHFGYSPKTIPAYETVDASLDFRRIQSTLRGANPLGAYLTLVIPALVWLKNSYYKWVYWLAALAVLFFSYSRSAWIGTALALGIMTWQSLSKKLHWRWLATGCLIAALIIGGGLYLAGGRKSIQETLLHYSSSSRSPLSSDSQHLKAQRQAVKDIVHQPLGGGPGTAGPASFRNNHPPRIAENYYLQIGQEVGVLGLALFILINVLTAKEIRKFSDRRLSLVLLASLAGISLINLVSHAWTDDTLSLIWWGLAGIGLGSTLITGAKHEKLQTKS